jgi:hypothetical protein
LHYAESSVLVMSISFQSFRRQKADLRDIIAFIHAECMGWMFIWCMNDFGLEHSAATA